MLSILVVVLSGLVVLVVFGLLADRILQATQQRHARKILEADIAYLQDQLQVKQRELVGD